MNENTSEDDIYNDVFFIEDYRPGPPKPSRTLQYEQGVQPVKPPSKPPRRSTEKKSEEHLDDNDLSYIALNVTSDPLTHLTKNRAKQQEKRFPARLIRTQRASSLGGESKTIFSTALEFIRSYRTQSMVEFSKVRRTALKIKQPKNSPS